MTTKRALSRSPALALAVALCAALPLAATAATGATATTTQADATTTVWRCGAEGRSYSDAPCVGGRAIDAADPRSAEQVAQGRAVLAADMRRAESMRRERLERERHEAKYAQRVPVSLSRAKSPLNPAEARRAGVTKRGEREQAEQAQQAPKLSKPKLARAQRPPSSLPADDGIWQATAPASPRAPG